LVVAGTHPHTFRNRLATESVDWKLIRLCPVPLLLVKSGRKLQGSPVVVAVDPFHARAQVTHLDAQMLRVGRAYAHWLKAPAHVFHAFMPLIPVQTLPIAAAAPLMVLTPEEEATHRTQVQRRIAALARSAGIPKAGQHIQFGDVPRELTAITRSTRAGLVVMGAVSRSTLGRILIGNTAERVLDKLACDVLIVKPPAFRTSQLAKLLKPPQQVSTVESASMVIL
jgi:universal stress protein E